MRSAMTEASPFQSTSEALEWLSSRSAASPFSVEPIPLECVDGWSFEESTGNLVHKSGKFFRVEGIRVETNAGPVARWEQPIIDQPEIGILGIVAKEFDGVLHFLMQAKMEPGNPSPVQLTPTVQATRSNYTQVHQGSRPRYVEYFLDLTRSTRLVDQLQFEQASAFLGKRNRNMVVLAAGDVPVFDNYRWLTMGQVKQLLRIPNLVSMEARTVLSCIPLVANGWDSASAPAAPAGDFGMALFESMLECGQAMHGDDEVLSWLADLRCRYELRIERVPLRTVDAWSRDHFAIAHDGGQYFSVVGVRVEATSREVARWDQPLVKSVEKGLIGFLIKRINGVLHFLIQAKVEPGNVDILSVGPTVQCVLGAECISDPASWPPLADLVVGAPAERVRYSCTQAEEGGRFYHVENDYRVVELPADENPQLSDGYCWVTLRQLNDLLRHGHVNIEARNLLGCLSLI